MLTPLERYVWIGQPAAVLDVGATTTDRASRFALARALKQEEDFRAAGAILQDIARSGDDIFAWRAHAHLAHVSYYQGNFAGGLVSARSAQRSKYRVARIEGHLYASVNALALNDGSMALAEATRARYLAQHEKDPDLRRDLRLRIARQFVHVAVACGDYVTADAEASAARSLASKLCSSRLLGLASYLQGFSRAARGSVAASEHYTIAAAHWGARYRSFGRWLRFVWACCARDEGDAARARALLQESGVSLPWEDPLFDLAEGKRPIPPSVELARADEKPFVWATRGLIQLVAGAPSEARESLTEAVLEFARNQLDHYRRGAALALAAAEFECGNSSASDTILSREVVAIQRYGLRRWPWWHAHVANRITRRVGTPVGVPSGEAGRMRSIAEVLSVRGLTAAEVAIVTQWIDHADWTRCRLANEIGISEASLRNHLNHVRRKLGCGPQRGIRAILASLGQPIVRASINAPVSPVSRAESTHR